ncbi:MAG: hypothetical protein ACJ74Y_06855 [Bryobacteraceae bacterium]
MVRTVAPAQRSFEIAQGGPGARIELSLRAARVRTFRALPSCASCVLYVEDAEYRAIGGIREQSERERFQESQLALRVVLNTNALAGRMSQPDERI